VLGLLLLLGGQVSGVLAQARPLRIGFGMALTGGLAANGKAALLAMQIWAEDINVQGGLLGRPVELVFYDDQRCRRSIPSCWTWTR
jgi:branched-chain amino acid transport system substrate-binding protein